MLLFQEREVLQYMIYKSFFSYKHLLHLVFQSVTTLSAGNSTRYDEYFNHLLRMWKQEHCMTKPKQASINTISTIALFFFITFLSSPIIGLAYYLTQSSQLLHPVSLPQNEEIAAPPLYHIVSEAISFGITDKPEFDMFTFEERMERGLPTKIPEITPYFNTKVVYLTFDDGPDPENTPKILDILKENKIKGTFFVIGSEVEKHPEILQRIFQEGHAIGNHTYNHVYKDLYHSPSAYTQQLHRTDRIIKSFIGVRPRISRAPGGSSGSFNKNYWDKLKTEGYIEVGWNVSSGDASRAKAEQITHNII